MKNILVADSGATKTDWAIGTQRFTTQGISPIHQDDDTILAILREELLPRIAGITVDAVHFYGSGVRPEQEERLAGLLKSLPLSPSKRGGTLLVGSDLLGAARALLGHEEGIACILGTGANSGLYDGNNIVQNTPPLGYILGDEGSGAVLGRLLLNGLYKGRLPSALRQAFEEEMGLTLSEVIDHVYRQPMPSRWLASLSPFVHRHLDVPEVEQMVTDNFRAFLRLNIAPYRRPDLPVNAVGSIAYYYRPQLQQAAEAEGCQLGRILKSPIDSLAV